MPEDTPPPILYKYLDFKGGMAMLENCTLKFTSPIQFNDPFEFLGKASDDLTESDCMAAYINSFVKTGKEYEFAVQNTPFKGSKADWDKYISEHPEFHKERAHELYENYKHHQEIWDELKQDWASRYGVFCASSKCNDILMWSHYADKHQGIVVGITSKLGGMGMAMPWYRVEYSNDRIGFSLSFNAEDLPYEEFRNLLKRKAKAWEYESEWRLIVGLENQTFVPLAPFAIKEVILGCKVEDEKAICSIVSSKFPHVNLRRSKPSAREFSIEIE